ncbi:hypothetical protein KVR01_011701 [Diaporthe batatas]|uniref:uncharacterized protein n=1 Tax=Diaporthe batatas TaxID=748121 RepID=UPI001D0401BD|nr:uncharacterized protein KVR01_011701 [Diaporthe batatas]KAG8158579.1 hypothetical protein KVR01_011701 [Diaporthe batatas]
MTSGTANMLATRFKLQWPRATATVGSAFRARARCLGTTTTSTTTSSSSSSSPTTTTTTPPEEGSRYGDEDRGQHNSSSRIRRPSKGSRSPYMAHAYEPEPMSYVDLLGRATSYPRWGLRRAIARARAMLGTDQYVAAAAGDTAAPEAGPAERPPSSEPERSLEDVLNRAAIRLSYVSDKLAPVLSAVAEDVAQRRVPSGNTNDPATLRTHALGRWYARWQQLMYESRAIGCYLESVASNTEKARRQVLSSRARCVQKALRVHEDAMRDLLQEYRGPFEAAAYDMAGELRAARLAGEWRRVWTLERRLAATAPKFLPSQPLLSVYKVMRDSQDGVITEISMARMAEWDDSYESLYAEDAQARGGMNLASRYRTIFDGARHLKPWKGESPVYILKSPTSDDMEFLVLRLDQRMRPSPLWPQDWDPIRPSTRRVAAGARLELAEPTGEVEQRATNTPPNTRRPRPRRILGAHKAPKTKNQEQQGSPDAPAKADTPAKADAHVKADTHAKADTPESRQGSLRSDEPT